MEEEDVLKEAFFSPSDGEGATLQALFDAFSKAAELNPEPGEEAGEEPQGEGELVFDHGRCAYARWCSLATWSSFFLSVDARFVFLCVVRMVLKDGVRYLHTIRIPSFTEQDGFGSTCCVWIDCFLEFCSEYRNARHAIDHHCRCASAKAGCGSA